MSDQRAWIIGAASECDVVVVDATVSGRHCRLTRSDDGFLLEDLGSTNGTFVNGTRLTTPLAVSATDEIKLGPVAVFPWEVVEPAAAGSSVIRIGRLPDNDVVLDYPNVSGHHVQIVIQDGLTTIEDFGLTNGGDRTSRQQDYDRRVDKSRHRFLRLDVGVGGRSVGSRTNGGGGKAGRHYVAGRRGVVAVTAVDRDCRRLGCGTGDRCRCGCEFLRRKSQPC